MNMLCMEALPHGSAEPVRTEIFEVTAPTRRTPARVHTGRPPRAPVPAYRPVRSARVGAEVGVPGVAEDEEIQ